MCCALKDSCELGYNPCKERETSENVSTCDYAMAIRAGLSNMNVETIDC